MRQSPQLPNCSRHAGTAYLRPSALKTFKKVDHLVSKSHKLKELDSIRGAAAVYVVIYHTRLFATTVFAPIFSIGPEAVILFFLLSGFVISYSSEHHLGSPGGVRRYLTHRVRRIYALFLIALALTWVMASVRASHPVPLQPESLLANLLMFQDVSWLKQGAWFSTYLGNDPLWSLSYEWWFYLLFPMVLLSVPRRFQSPSVLAVSCLAAVTYKLVPSQPGLWLGYFFIRWAGVEMARQFRAVGDVTWRGQSRTLMGLALLALAWSVPVIIATGLHQKLRIGFEPMLQLRHSLAALVFVVIALLWHSKRFIGFDQTLGWFGYIAPISYALYIFHAPIVQTAVGSSPVHAILLYGVVLLPLCYLCEVILQPSINRAFDHFLEASKPHERRGLNSPLDLAPQSP